MTIMRTTFPINSETEIPAVGFGTYLIPPEDTAAAVRKAIAVGYRHTDTAAVYQNEHGVGAGIRAGMRENSLSREDIFVTTKYWPDYSSSSKGPSADGHVSAACDASLARLGLEYVDLYLIHSPHGGAKRLDQWRALLELKRIGKARAVGVSNFNQKHLEEIKAAGLPMPEVNQIELHPWSQKPELVAYMRANRIAPIAYSSLAPLSSWRSKPGQDSAKTADMKKGDTVFKAMAEKHHVTEAQLLLRWGVQNGYAVIPKSLDPERMRQNIDLDGFAIDDEEMALIKTMDRGDGIAWSTGDPSQVD